jgi:hypothetical protein
MQMSSLGADWTSRAHSAFLLEMENRKVALALMTLAMSVARGS